MDLTDAATILDQLVSRLREKGVRSFKGDLKDASGLTIWTLDLTFERPSQKQKADDDE